VLDAAMDMEARQAAKTFRAVTLAAPPQHGKTTITECAFIKALKTCPSLHHAYATYGQDVTDRIERETRMIAEACGLIIKGTRTDWYIPETNSHVRWTSIGGALTSHPVDGLLVVDDPFKDFATARSHVERETAWSWLVGVALRRLHPGAWLVEMATRWHEDDLTGRMRERWNTQYINIQAICEDKNDGTGRSLGDVLWPEERPAEFIEQQRDADPIPFEAQYQGRPRSAGDALFGQPHRFTELPDPRTGFVEAYGADLAYSKKTTADWSVLFRGRRYGDKIYVLRGIRKRQDATAFLATLEEEERQVNAPCRFYHGGGGELGVTQFFQRDVRQLHALPATADKVVRSTECRKSWNLGNILLPSEDSEYYGPWVNDLIQELSVFTGIGDAHDDQIDGLTAMHDELMASMAQQLPRPSGERKIRKGGLGAF